MAGATGLAGLHHVRIMTGAHPAVDVLRDVGALRITRTGVTCLSALMLHPCREWGTGPSYLIALFFVCATFFCSPRTTVHYGITTICEHRTCSSRLRIDAEAFPT